jgi:hypothetical protein
MDNLKSPEDGTRYLDRLWSLNLATLNLIWIKNYETVVTKACGNYDHYKIEF